MAYRNGKDALPPRLLKMVQRYAAGDCLYIPRETRMQPQRRSDPALVFRNREIRNAYKKGQSVKALSARYYLSTQSIYKILHQE
ncbi:MAG: hypothetical protein IKT57_01485 [Clostridia bacterium]|nr:hypothetical protein [Clostridia bacterium]